MDFLHPRRAQAIRDEIVRVARWGIAHEPEIHYAEIRPIPEHVRPLSLPLTTDCSGFVTLCYLWGGARDPNGQGYNGTGFTGTLLAHGRRRPIAQLAPGDLIVYGPPPGHHVVLVLVAGTDPLVASHGGERGPAALLHSAEQKFQPTPATGLTFTLV